MKKFEYVAPKTIEEAISYLGRSFEKARVLAGGMDLIGEMKLGIEEPERIVNLKSIEELKYIKFDSSGLKIGALTTLVEIEEDNIIRERYTAISQAAASVGSPQIRNVGTIGGNLCQRPRCWYYRDPEVLCLRKGGRKCFAVAGENKYHCILGGGPCYIVHPSDCAPALIAFNSKIKIYSPRGSRDIPLEDFFVLPRVNPRYENILKPDEIIVEVVVPTPKPGTKSLFIKVSERGSWDFAIASVSIVMKMNGDICEESRIVLGACAPVPWRAKTAERILNGRRVNFELASKVGEMAVQGARPLAQNKYKIQLFKNLVMRAVVNCSGIDVI
jgi:xanthine dehydrogenase YagS FAD-binding subunit